MKQLLIINGHPDKESFNFALEDAFVSGINRSKWNLTIIHLSELDFDPILRFGYRKRTELEPDLINAIQKIKEANHVVWFFPMWWYGVPALLKGFIDRTFLPGIAFEYVEGKPLPKKLFVGKSAQLIITADTPSWYDWLFIGRPAIKQFKKGTLEFCGFSPVKVTYISPIRNSSEDFRKKWLTNMKKISSNL
jgi:NAD(P)H dehydrogenase (quinone)